MATLSTSYTKIGEQYLGSSYGDLYIRIYAKYTSQSIANNCSYVTYQSRLYFSGNYIISKEPTNVTTKGSGAQDTTTNWKYFEGRQDGRYEKGETVVKTITGTVYHNSSTGKASISASAYANAGPWNWKGTASGSADLPTIPRETPAPAFSSAYVEQTVTLAIAPKISGAQHSVKMVFGSLTNWLQSNGSLGSSEKKLSGKSLTMVIPKTYYKQFSGESKTGTLTLYTYNGDTKVGSGKSVTFKISCNPTLCIPNISGTAKDTNSVTVALTGDENTVVANASNIQVIPTIRISDSDDTTATITSKKVNKTSFTTSTYTFEKATTKSFEISVTNSRGLTNSKTVSMSRLVPYVSLTFNVIDLYRPEPTTGEIALEYSGKYYPGEFTNGLGKDTKYLEVGDKLVYDNITFSFPDDLYLSMQDLETNKKHTIVKTNEYEIFYGKFDTSYDGVESPYIEYSVWYSEIDGNNQMTPYHVYITKSNGTFVTGAFMNETTIISGADLGTVVEVNSNDTIVYPYITEKTINNGTFNTLDITWKYKPKSSNTYIDGGVLTPKINTEKNTYSGKITLGTNFDYKQQYDFIFYYKDKIINSSLKKSVTRGLPIFWWSEDAVHIVGDLYVEGEINPK